MTATAPAPRHRIGSLDFYYPNADDAVWHVIDAQFAARGLDPPYRTNKVAVAEDADGHVSFFMLQGVLHAEPMLIHEAHRGNPAVLPNLISMIQAWIEAGSAMGRDVYVVADTAETVKMCEWYGMELVQVPVYRKVVGKEQR
jgi:hypothetical protein